MQLFRETTDFPPPCSSLCNSTPLSSPVSAIGHTAGLPVETHGAESHYPPTNWLDGWSVSQPHTLGAPTSCIHVVPEAPEFKRWFADIRPLCFTAINSTSHSLSLHFNRLAPRSGSLWEYSHCFTILGEKEGGWMKVYNLRWHLAMLTRHDHACHLWRQAFHSPVPTMRSGW